MQTKKYAKRLFFCLALIAIAVLFSFIFFVLDDNAKRSTHSSAISEPAAPSLSKITMVAHGTAESLYQEYQADIQACKSGFAYLNENESELTKLLLSVDSEEYVAAIEKSRFATHPSLQRIFKYPKRFEISTNCHTGDYSARTINCLYCDSEHKVWASDIEKIGVTQQGLSIRLHILNLILKDLNYPYDEASYGSDYTFLLAEAKTTERIYGAKFIEPLNFWLQQAANEIRSNKVKAADNAGGQTIQKQIDRMENWASSLEELKCSVPCGAK